jgi:hypothetical protein
MQWRSAVRMEAISSPDYHLGADAPANGCIVRTRICWGACAQGTLSAEAELCRLDNNAIDDNGAPSRVLPSHQRGSAPFRSIVHVNQIYVHGADPA